MPFPVIDRTRYWSYAGGITALLVHIDGLSSSIPTTTTSSLSTCVTALSETSSPSSLPTSSLMLMPHTANKSWKSIFSTSIATSELTNSSNRTLTCSNTQVLILFTKMSRRLYGGLRTSMRLLPRSTDKPTTTRNLISRTQNSSCKTSLTDMLTLRPPHLSKEEPPSDDQHIKIQTIHYISTLKSHNYQM